VNLNQHGHEANPQEESSTQTDHCSSEEYREVSTPDSPEIGSITHDIGEGVATEK
jgi:hypothetical protein